MVKRLTGREKVQISMPYTVLKLSYFANIIMTQASSQQHMRMHVYMQNIHAVICEFLSFWFIQSLQFYKPLYGIRITSIMYTIHFIPSDALFWATKLSSIDHAFYSRRNLICLSCISGVCMYNLQSSHVDKMLHYETYIKLGLQIYSSTCFFFFLITGCKC